LQARVSEIEQQRRALERASEGAQQEAEIAKLETALKLARDRYERVKRLVEVGMESPQTLTEVEVGLGMIEQKIVAAKQGGQLREQKEKIADLTAQLELARQRLERTNRLFAAGLVNASAVKEAEAEVTTIELKLAAVRKQLQLQETNADLQRRQAERQAEIAEIERVLREIGTSGQAGRHGNAEQQAKQGARSIDAALAEVEARHSAATASERDQRLLSSSAPVANANETVRVGDLLVIEIAGEPDLPRVYIVADTGAIRLPLIGNVPVRDLTALQVREAVMRELKERRLADDPSVTVSLRRIR
jgi:multidrug resistance efflux pump